MSLLPAPLEPTRPGLLPHVAPVTRVAVGVAWLLAAALTVDPVVPARLAIIALVVLAFASGLPIGRVARRISPLLIAAAGLAAITVLLHPSNGDPGADAVVSQPIRIAAPAVAAAVALALRLLVIALVSVLVFGPSDPTRLADSLAQHVRVPDRVAYGTLAAVRIAPLLEADWAATAAARRLRGLDGGVAAELRSVPGRLLALLVAAVRRAERVALAMDARGFDAGIPRSRFRPRPLRALDAAVLLVGLAIAGAALLVGRGG